MGHLIYLKLLFIVVYCFIFGREYAKKRIKFEFEKNKQIADKEKLSALLTKAESDLESLKRQVC